MKYQIDQNQEEILKAKIAEILTDYTRMIHGDDIEQEKTLLLKAMFARESQGSLSSLLQSRGGATDIGGILEDTYFPDLSKAELPLSAQANHADQMTFLESMRASVMLITFDMKSPELLFPKAKYQEGKKTPEVKFDDPQLKLIELVIMPASLAAIEAKYLAKPEEKTSVQKNKNVYAKHTNEILVMGESGEFDTVITLRELQIISDNIKQYPGVSQAEIILKVLAENKKKPKLSALGEFIPFSCHDFAIKEKDAQGFATYSVSELEKAFKIRLGRKLQFDYIVASKGNIIPASGIKKMTFPGATHDVVFNAGAINIDTSGGKGNNLHFSVSDRRGGGEFMVTIAISAANNDPDFKHSLRPSTAEDENRFDLETPELRLPDSQMPTAVAASSLPELYSKAQQYETEETAAEEKKPRLPESQGLKPQVTPAVLMNERQPKMPDRGVPIVYQPLSLSATVSAQLPIPPETRTRVTTASVQVPSTSTRTTTSAARRFQKPERVPGSPVIPRPKAAKPAAPNQTPPPAAPQRAAAQQLRPQAQAIAQQEDKPSFWQKNWTTVLAVGSGGVAAALPGAAGLLTLLIN